MKNKSQKLMFFDWDGFLAYTNEILFEIMKSVNPNFTIQDFENLSMGNWYERNREFKFLVPDDFGKQYRQGLFSLEIKDEVQNIIKEFSQEYMLFIITSNSGRTISDYLLAKSMRHHFIEILGSEYHESKKVKIEHALSRHKRQNHNAIFLTDSVGDVLEATEAGVLSIAGTWGIHNAKQLEKVGPEYIVHDIQHLPSLIKTIFK